MAKLIVDIPEDLRDRLKIYCIQHKTTVKNEIISLLEAFFESVDSEKDKSESVPEKAKEEKEDIIDKFMKPLGS